MTATEFKALVWREFDDATRDWLYAEMLADLAAWLHGVSEAERERLTQQVIGLAVLNSMDTGSVRH